MEYPIVVIIVALIAAFYLKSAGVKRIKTDDNLAGICAGIAAHYDMSAVGVRVLWVLLSLFLGGGIITYIVLWCILPKRG
jgi:phage shock protein C